MSVPEVGGGEVPSPAGDATGTLGVRSGVSSLRGRGVSNLKGEQDHRVPDA